MVGSVPTWTLAASAQQPDRMRRIGVLVSLAAVDPEGQARLIAFPQGLQDFGWAIGRNVRIEFRWSAGDATMEASVLLPFDPDAGHGGHARLWAPPFPSCAARG